MDMPMLAAVAAIATTVGALTWRSNTRKQSALAAAAASLVAVTVIAGYAAGVAAATVALLSAAAGTVVAAIPSALIKGATIDCFRLGGSSATWSPVALGSRAILRLFGGPILPHQAFSPLLQLELLHRAEAIASDGGRLEILIEAAANPADVLAGVSPRSRAVRMFAEKGLWNTGRRDGVLVLLTLADRSIEIVADRALCGGAATERLAVLAKRMALSFRDEEFKDGLRRAAWEISRIVDDAKANDNALRGASATAQPTRIVDTPGVVPFRPEEAAI